MEAPAASSKWVCVYKCVCVCTCGGGRKAAGLDGWTVKRCLQSKELMTWKQVARGQPLASSVLARPPSYCCSHLTSWRTLIRGKCWTDTSLICVNPVSEPFIVWVHLGHKQNDIKVKSACVLQRLLLTAQAEWAFGISWNLSAEQQISTSMQNTQNKRVAWNTVRKWRADDSLWVTQIHVNTQTLWKPAEWSVW